jgi:polysaccharide export outer membrane protein
MVKITAAPLMSLVAVGLTLLPAYGSAQTPTSSSATQSTGRTTTRAATARWNEQDYKLGPGDKLRIEVYKQEQLSQSLQIRPDGKITLPLVGDVAAAGSTSLELRDTLSTALKEYVQNPVVTVIVQEAVAAQVHLIGEVASPGTQVLNGSTTVLQALARAGGLREFADRRKIRILRVNGTRTDTIPFDYRKALKGEIEPVYLQPGDTIVVP